VPVENVENLLHHAEHPLHDSLESPASARDTSRENFTGTPSGGAHGTSGERDLPGGRRHALGRVGEALAVAHLEARGFALLARNYRTRRGEIDLIAFDGCTLLFVEVKTQRMEPSEAQVRPNPLEWLSTRQQKRRRPLAMAWLYDRTHPRPMARNIRFDAIGVVVDEQGAMVDLEHLEGIE
jgi:putative endonuclease